MGEQEMDSVGDVGSDYLERPDDDDGDSSYDFPMSVALHLDKTSAVLHPDKTPDESDWTTSDFESSWVTTAWGQWWWELGKTGFLSSVVHISSCPVFAIFTRQRWTCKPP